MRTRCGVRLPPESSASTSDDDSNDSDGFAPGGFTYSVTFSEPMTASNLDASDVTLLGVTKNVSYAPATLTYSAGNTVLTTTYSALSEDAYVLTLLSADGRFEVFTSVATTDLTADNPAGAAGRLQSSVSGA